MKGLALLVLALISKFIVIEAPLPFIVYGVAAGVSGLAAWWQRCKVAECCEVGWIPSNITGLKETLERQLYGQHLALDTVVSLLTAHVQEKQPHKPLVLSFNGWSGVGKNYVSKIIADNIFSLGMKSSFVHFRSATHDFPHEKYVDTYKDQILELIKASVAKCGHSLFIFDEVEKMPVGLLDSLTTFLNHHEHIQGVDYRKAMFIFLSNSGGQAINSKVLELYRGGRKREDIKLKDLETVVRQEAYKDGGGLKSSSLIDYYLVSAFVPFLPLERHHVRLCTRDILKARNHTASEDVIDKVLAELEFFPEDTRQFSLKGCKGIWDKVNLVLAQM